VQIQTPPALELPPAKFLRLQPVDADLLRRELTLI